jgi:hypothetical protein
LGFYGEALPTPKHELKTNTKTSPKNKCAV